MTKIDAHHHFWHPARGDYFWMPEGDGVLDRPYAPDDLRDLLHICGVDKTVLVQAAPAIVETEYMLGIADATDFVAGVVGWIDFERAGDRAELKRLARHPAFKGVRPMIQDIPDVDWMLRDDIQWAFEALCELDLAFDALGFPRHLANFLTLFERYPDLRVVIDHCMKPQIEGRTGENFGHWADGMSRLAETGAYCKLSGLVTESGEDWTPDALAPYAEHVLAAFGSERVMWGSDWPVCRLRAEYTRWHETAQTLCADLDAAGKARVFGGTAAEFYRIST